MTAIEDPAPPPSTEAAGAAEPRDDLEHWLSDLRTDVAANPADWIDVDPDGEPPAGEAVDHAEPAVPEPRTVGRHRSPD